MFTAWTVSLPKDIQALLNGRKTVEDTTKARVHAFLAEIGSPDRALLTCAVIAGKLAEKNIETIPALTVIQILSARIVNQCTLLDENDCETLSPAQLCQHFTNVRDDLRSLSEAMQMTADAFGPDMVCAGWLAQALSQQTYAHAIIAETIAEAHLDSGNTKSRKSHKKTENRLRV